MPSHGVIQFTELLAYLSEKRESARAFFRRAEIEKSAGSRLLNGQFKSLDFDVVTRVSAATEGAISAPQFEAFVSRLKSARASESPTEQEAA